MGTAPNAKNIGNASFQNSLFIGNSRVPKATTIGQYAFRTSVFDGVFDAPLVKTVGRSAFEKSPFTSRNAPLLMETILTSSAFTAAKR